MMGKAKRLERLHKQKFNKKRSSPPNPGQRRRVAYSKDSTSHHFLGTQPCHWSASTPPIGNPRSVPDREKRPDACLPPAALHWLASKFDDLFKHTGSLSVRPVPPYELMGLCNASSVIVLFGILDNICNDWNFDPD